MLRFHIISLFPQTVEAYLGESILKRAIENKKIAVSFYNPKDFAEPSNNPELMEPIDDRPFGGGPGMVLKAEPFLKAIEKAIKNSKSKNPKIIYFSPRGKIFNTKMAKEIAEKTKEIKSENKILHFLKRGFIKKPLTDIILVSGRYEGIDSRVQEIYEGEEISVGDFVLTGGELPAMILIDSISRQLPGVLGNFDSREEERISAGKYYTRPEIIN
jgi:tRNA (guanine37-N1)-methyltransferase